MSTPSAWQQDSHKHAAKLGTRTDSRNVNSYRFESCLLKGQPGDLTAQSYQELEGASSRHQKMVKTARIWELQTRYLLHILEVPGSINPWDKLEIHLFIHSFIHSMVLRQLHRL